MRMPKKFDKWFHQYGVLDDGWSSLEDWQRYNIKRIAYRAYKRGLSDGKSSILQRNNSYTPDRSYI